MASPRRSHPTPPLYYSGTGLTELDFDQLTDTPTTLAGYGITDAYTDAEVDALLAAASGVSGSGTANFFPKWSDSDTLTDSAFFDESDGSVKRLRVNAGAMPAQIWLQADAGNVRDIVFSSTTGGRWIFRCDLTAESGSDSGSNFVINRRNDAGDDLGDALSLSRATGVATFQSGLVTNNGGLTTLSNNVYDIGQSAAQFRSLYLGTSLVVNGFTRINTTRPAWAAPTAAQSRTAVATGQTLAATVSHLAAVVADLRSIGIFA